MARWAAVARMNLTLESIMDLKTRIDIAAGRQPADLVLRGGKIVNVLSGEIHDGDVAIAGDRIAGIGQYDGKEVIDLDGQYICPGLIDAHVHIESSMLAVPQFARVVSAHGTTTAITDPHEIANVMGSEGIRYMLASSKYCPLHIYVMVSSCVPASRYETAGADLDALDIEPLLGDPWVLGLAEMMNYPGVVYGDADCLAKISAAASQVVDGHAPGLGGRDLCAYAASGVASDHECTTASEAAEKLRQGMYIMIREGSQARNLKALLPLVTPANIDRFMFCTDDKDVTDLLEEGQIDHIIRQAIALGMDPISAVRLGSHTAARYFGLRDLGAVAPGRLASLAIVDNLKSFRVRRVYHAGRLVAVDGEPIDQPTQSPRKLTLRSSINVKWIEPEQFVIAAPDSGDKPCHVHVMEVMEDRIDTERSIERILPSGGALHAEPSRDLAKIAVIERHQASGNIGLGFVRGFGMTAGAIASTVGHDSHNLVVAGTNDADMQAAAVHLVKIRGGFCAVRDGLVLADVALPIAGLMSDQDADVLSDQLVRLHEKTAAIITKLRRPFMALSFLTLSVIGKLKLTDQGLVDVDRFELIDLIAHAH